ncbi:MAG: ATP--guanido phosphotransferase, partial [Candidatus Eisenbacteria bacterium]|nr:ATP--guanido phosphotransferase [Candidatus Latescibacterota bacterium]MBD3303463.1 ATP--guanido phosphotransferase [Candidatus Eisenbacteria bacterium]
RNLTGTRFVGRCSPEELRAAHDRIRAVVAGLDQFDDGWILEIAEIGLLDRQFLLERHLLSHDLTSEGRSRGVAVTGDEAISVMFNEEDHLRLQCLKSGMQLDEAWKAVDELDDRLARELPIAYDGQLGYLTSCPTNVGTGVRASLLIHLPALVLTQKIKKVLAGVSQVGLAVRGFHGEGSDVLGNFFQISNQVTLGMTEESTLDKLQGVVLQVLEMEEKARDSLQRDARPQVLDKIGRSLGTLKYARILSSQECMGLLSAVRLGVTMGLKNLPDLATLNEILLCCQPAHLQKRAGREMSSMERNERRAEWIRQTLGVSDAPQPR